MFNSHTSLPRVRGIKTIAAGCASIVAFIMSGSAQAALVYGVTAQDILVSWNSATPGTIQNGISLLGLANNEHIQGIDFRPANGQLYAIGSQSNLYTINVATGQATPVNGGVNNPLNPLLNGANFGFDFNPVADRMRLVSDADQNMRVNPDTGVVTVDTPLAYATGDVNFGVNPNVVDAAYSNNFAGAASTTLYAIDTGLDRLVRIGSLGGSPTSPNTGQLFTVGSLGADFAEDGGFDILTTVSGVAGSIGDTAYASLRLSNSAISGFYSINLTTGAATLIGQIGGGLNIRAMAVAPVPAPGALSLLACAATLVGRRRRRA